MKKITLFLFLILFNYIFSQVTVDDTVVSAQTLIQNNLIGNPNFPASNFLTISGANQSGPNSIGTFTANEIDLPFSEGLVLTTGDVTNVPGANISILSAGSSSWQGDLDLEGLTSITTTNNASVLQFDFVADVSAISLDFIMASEEYGESFECDISDAFAFIVTNNNTGLSKNIAVVPNSTTPIAVTSVHAGGSNSCSPVNAIYFNRYNYEVENTSAPSISAADSPINFNGQTEVFVLTGDLIIGDSYTIKIVIADAVDTFYDSALFIRNRSFGAYPVIDNDPEDIVVEDIDNDGTVTFNLTLNEDLILGTIDSDVYTFLVTYHNVLADAELGVNSIENPMAYETTSNLEEIFVRIRNPFTDTAITTSFRIANNAELLNVSESEIIDLSMYPNPVKDALFIETNTSNIESVHVYAINGQLIFTEKFNGLRTIKVDFSDFNSGMYLLKLISENGITYKRVLK